MRQVLARRLTLMLDNDDAVTKLREFQSKKPKLILELNFQKIPQKSKLLEQSWFKI